MKEDLSEKWHMKKDVVKKKPHTNTGFVTKNKLMLKTLCQTLQWDLSYSDNYPNNVYRDLPDTSVCDSNLRAFNTELYNKAYTTYCKHVYKWVTCPEADIESSHCTDPNESQLGF